MSGKKQASADNLNPLPSYLKITRAPSWARLNEIPPWPELYREVWLVNERRWCDPATHQPLDLPLHNRMWDMFKRAADLVIRDLASIPWDRVPSSDPISLYELNLCVQIGILSLAPPDISDPGVRGFLFFDTLIRKAILDHSGVSRMTPKHALAAYVGYRGGPRVEAEMIRRVSKHIGGHAAILKWCFAMYRDNKAGFDFDDTWQASQKRLATFIFWKLARRLHRTENPYPDWMQKDVEDEIPGWILQTLETEPMFAETDPFQALAAGLQGKLNIFPWRVADRIRNSLRDGIDRHAKREEPRDPEELMKIVDDRDKTSQANLEDFLKKHPEHKDNAEIALSDEPHKTLAAERGITERALRLRQERFRNDLKRFLSRR